MRILLVSLIVAAGCAEAPPPVNTTLAVTQLRPKAKQPAPPAGITIVGLGTVLAVNAAALKLEVPIVWKERDIRQQVTGSGNSMIEHGGPVPIVPLPTFIVKLKNGSPAPIKFDAAQVVFDDGAGHTWPGILDAKEAADRVEKELVRRYPAAADNPNVLTGLRNALGKLPFTTPATQVAAGSDWEGLIPIKLDGDAGEIEAIVQAAQKPVLRISNLGGAAKPFELTFELEKETVQLAVTCPGGDKQPPPSLKTCKPAPQVK
jgi:hypothetical protein